MTVAPGTLTDFQAQCSKNLGTVNLGIVGDSAHIQTGGYHIGALSLRNAGMGRDYSLSYSIDANCGNDFACAVDLGGKPDLLMTLGNRLVHALKAHDPRVYGRVRGTNAPWDGWQIDRRYDCENPNSARDDNTQSSDDRGHIHIEIYRTLVTEQNVVNGLYSVLAGEAMPVPTGPYLHRVWPSWMPSGHYFGVMTGPVQSHGGYYPAERPTIAAIQRRLNVTGDKPGIFGINTKTAVTAWQKKNMPGTQFFGQIWPDDFRKLFTF